MSTPLPEFMTCIEIKEFGGPEGLVPAERPMPEPAEGEVLIAVEAAGVNRPDVVQREGNYAPPPGATDIPGLEVSGTVVKLGDRERRKIRGHHRRRSRTALVIVVVHVVFPVMQQRIAFLGVS